MLAVPLSVALLAVFLIPISPLPTLPSGHAALPAMAEAAAPAESPAAIPASPLTVSLAALTPTVAVPKAPITISGTVANSGEAPVGSPVARALVGQRPLTSRLAVSNWADSTGGQGLDVVALTPLGKSLAPGSVTAFTLTVPADAISHQESFAILPLRIQVNGTSSATAQQTQETEQSGDVHTFLPTLAAVKAFEPLSVAWLVPLTLDPDPALLGPANPARAAAWTKAIGPGSRLDRLITGTETTSVTWAIDPAILGPRPRAPGADGSAAPSPSPSASQPTPSGTTVSPDPVTGTISALTRRLKAAAPRHTLWSLPYADPDLASMLATPSGARLLSTLISHPSTVNAKVGPARSDVAWPISGTLTPQTQTQLRSLYSAPGLAAAVTSTSSLTGPNDSADSSGDASRKAGSGLPLLAYDESLSRVAAQTSSRAKGAVTIQRFLADSMALLGERPGTPDRSVLVAGPRTFAADPTVLRALFAAVSKAPWLVPATTDQLLTESQSLAPDVSRPAASEPTAPASPEISPTAQPTTSDPLSSGTSPMTSDQIATIPDTLSQIAGTASILGDGQRFAATWTDAQVQKLSARWRDRPEALTAIDAATKAAIDAVGRSVRVAPSSVNFFADDGVLQVTVVNELAVPIHDVHLTLTPDQPRLRIARQPGPLAIGAKSRRTVPLQVTSIAAGLVRIEAALTTGEGSALGQTASVDVRVQPTSTWIFWVLGGLAGLVLIVGIQRSLRRGSTRAANPDLQGPRLHG